MYQNMGACLCQNCIHSLCSFINTTMFMYIPRHVRQHIYHRVNIYIYIYIYINILKMNKEVGMLLPKKETNTSGVGKINNYCEDIYIPAYNNTH